MKLASMSCLLFMEEAETGMPGDGTLEFNPLVIPMHC